jgi:hypothetical protein
VPSLTRWYLRCALAYLVGGMGALALLWWARAGWAGAVWLGMWPTALHMLTVGWMTQMIWGVGFWLLPPASRARPHGRDGFLRAAFVLLNVGLLLRIVGEPAMRWASAPGADTLTAWTAPVLGASATMQWLACVLATVALWPRIRSSIPPRNDSRAPG